jgi:hypothetical protein
MPGHTIHCADPGWICDQTASRKLMANVEKGSSLVWLDPLALKRDPRMRSVPHQFTFNVVEPVTPLNVALIWVCPWLALDATPFAFITATVGVDEVHVTINEMSCVEPSLNRPLAANCCIEPSAIVGVAGVTVMLVTVAFETVRSVVADVPLYVAVMVAEPAATPVTRPCRLITASW